MSANETEKSLTLLTNRIDRLEKRNRWTATVAWILGAILLVVVTCGAAPGRANPAAKVTDQDIRDVIAMVQDLRSETREELDALILRVIDLEARMLQAENRLMAIGELDNVRTKSLEITDNEGNVRAQMSLVNGEPSLQLLDGRGNVRGEFALQDDEPGLIIMGGEDGGSAGLTITGGIPGVYLLDQSMTVGVGITLRNGDPRLELLDEHGNLLFSAP